MTKLIFVLCIYLLLLKFKTISSITLHTASACFSKTFTALTFNATEIDDVPLRNDGRECGEDDFLITESGDIKLLTVADGVGSWRMYGVDPKVFTKELMESMNVQFKTLNETILAQHDKRTRSFLLNIIRNAYNDVQMNKTYIRFGSCTLVSLSFNMKTLQLNSYNLGDSGFMIIRKGKIVYRSKDLSHGFNWPYQLAFVDEHSNSPDDGFSRAFKLRRNDVIVIGSDGLFDNLFEDTILYFVKGETSELTPLIQKGYSEAARRIAKRLTIEAKRTGEIMNEIVTPFSEEVNSLKIFDFEVNHGKNDDTTVVVAILS